MSQRGRQGGRRGRPAERRTAGSADRPRRVRREPVKTRLRRGFAAKQTAGATRVLALSTTRRAAVLAIVVCALAFTLAVPLRTYLSQRSEIADQERHRTELRNEVAQLQARQAALNDPAQVETEARRRLRYVMPGETPYLVQLPEDVPPQQRPSTPRTPAGGDTAWYQQLWSTVGG